MIADVPRRVSIAVWSSVLVLALVACQRPGPSSSALLPDGEPATVAVRDGCALAQTRCVRCHTLDRVLLARVPNPWVWQTNVSRMRRMPGSGISPVEAQSIVQCLVFRSFGPVGLAQLQTPPTVPEGVP